VTTALHRVIQQYSWIIFNMRSTRKKHIFETHKSYIKLLDAMRGTSGSKVVDRLLECVHTWVCSVSFEKLLHYFLGHYASAVYALMEACDKLVEKIHKGLKANSIQLSGRKTASFLKWLSLAKSPSVHSTKTAK
jgi:hypothetical protein